MWYLQAAGRRPGSYCGLDLQPGVPGPVLGPGTILSMLSQHPKLHLLLREEFHLLSCAVAQGGLSALTPSPACQWWTQMTSIPITPVQILS